MRQVTSVDPRFSRQRCKHFDERKGSQHSLPPFLRGFVSLVAPSPRSPNSTPLYFHFNYILILFYHISSPSCTLHRATHLKPVYHWNRPDPLSIRNNCLKKGRVVHSDNRPNSININPLKLNSREM